MTDINKTIDTTEISLSEISVTGMTSGVPFWEPKALLRWKLKPDPNYPAWYLNKILQQQWRSSYGKVEWRDVPIEE